MALTFPVHNPEAITEVHPKCKEVLKLIGGSFSEDKMPRNGHGSI
jgi:hypothetical protein